MATTSQRRSLALNLKIMTCCISANHNASFMFIINNLGLSLVIMPVLTSHSLAISNIGRHLELEVHLQSWDPQ
ncbi:hypothetical protein F4604DRAFT_1914382 [Suillus subluteus]|nr:hypothetical protein F4604DRAFT_1928988 [Suillus subluteus]KAG1889862.1 hypothetical protein F4604DRAFT_1914382 [Suillus subluteus]